MVESHITEQMQSGLTVHVISMVRASLPPSSPLPSSPTSSPPPVPRSSCLSRVCWCTSSVSLGRGEGPRDSWLCPGRTPRGPLLTPATRSPDYRPAVQAIDKELKRTRASASPRCRAAPRRAAAPHSPTPRPTVLLIVPEEMLRSLSSVRELLQEVGGRPQRPIHGPAPAHEPRPTGLRASADGTASVSVAHRINQVERGQTGRRGLSQHGADRDSEVFAT